MHWTAAHTGGNFKALASVTATPLLVAGGSVSSAVMFGSRSTRGIGRRGARATARTAWPRRSRRPKLDIDEAPRLVDRESGRCLERPPQTCDEGDDAIDAFRALGLVWFQIPVGILPGDHIGGAPGQDRRRAVAEPPTGDQRFELLRGITELKRRLPHFDHRGAVLLELRDEPGRIPGIDVDFLQAIATGLFPHPLPDEGVIDPIPGSQREGTQARPCVIGHAVAFDPSGPVRLRHPEAGARLDRP